MAASERMVIRPAWLLDVVSGEVMAGRAVVVEGDRIAQVTPHAHGAEGIKRAVRGGVRSVEHGSLIDDEAVELMAAAGTFLVADIYCGDYIAEVGRQQGWHADVLRKNDETTLSQRQVSPSA